MRLALSPLTAAFELEASLGDIVDNAISGDMPHGRCLIHILGPASDNDAQFNLPIGPDGVARNFDRVVWTVDSRGGFHEYDRLIRNRHAGLGGMIGVVETNANKLAHTADRRTKTGTCVYAGQALNVDRLQGLLEQSDPKEVLRKVYGALAHELHILKLRHEIASQAQAEIGKSQREYFLRQQ